MGFSALGHPLKACARVPRDLAGELRHALLGNHRYDSGDASRNNKWVAALTFGEGWHNNHHAFPHSACHGLQKGQIDLTWEHIRLMRALGLAKNIRLPIKPA